MGVRTAERITDVSMESLRIRYKYIGCGAQALRCEKCKPKHGGVCPTHPEDTPKERPLPSISDTSARYVFLVSTGLNGISLPRRQYSPGFHRRSGRTTQAPQYPASGNKR